MRWGGKAPRPGSLGAPAPASKELRLEQRIPNIFEIPGALDAGEVAALIERTEQVGLELQTSRGPAYGEAVRHHSRTSFEDFGYAEALWRSGLDRALAPLRVAGRAPAGLNENIRIYKYSGGDVFGQHVDGSNRTSSGRTEYTLLIYLSGAAEGLAGGETVFYSEGREVLRVAPCAGTALVHRHGRECLLHESLPVQQGVKYVLRSDVVFPD